MAWRGAAQGIPPGSSEVGHGVDMQAWQYGSGRPHEIQRIDRGQTRVWSSVCKAKSLVGFRVHRQVFGEKPQRSDDAGRSRRR
jgi:hypothetical protein